MRKPSKRTKYILLGIAVLVVLGLIRYGFGILTANIAEVGKTAFADYLPPTFFLSKEDSNLISPRYRKKMTVLEVWNSKDHSPVSFVHIQSLFCLAMHKIEIGRDKPLDSILLQKNTFFGEGSGALYNVYTGSHSYQFECVDGKAMPVTKLAFATNAARVTKGISNDSIVNWQFVCSRFFIHYDQDKTPDIKIETNEGIFGSESRIAMDLLFLKRNGGVYLLLLTADDPKAFIPQGMLYDIIEGK